MGNKTSINNMDKQDEKILLCLLGHIDIPTYSDRKKNKGIAERQSNV